MYLQFLKKNLLNKLFPKNLDLKKKKKCTEPLVNRICLDMSANELGLLISSAHKTNLI